MNSLLDDNDDDIQDHHHGRSGHKQDREITLGTTMVLGIFFALAVFGAVMFGFGYSTGAKHIAATTAAGQADPNATFNGFKPPSGKTATDLAKTPAPTAVTVPLTTPSPVPRTVPKPVVDPVTAEAEVPVRPLPPAPVGRATPVAAPVPTPVSASTGQLMVQIAAVSHQEDADLLVSTLRRRSYAVAVHHEPQDQLLHIQVGPFATKKDADAMRQRLQADGFNAIVKDPSR